MNFSQSIKTIEQKTAEQICDKLIQNFKNWVAILN